MKGWRFLLVATLVGCTYGPEQERALIENVVVRPDSHEFAAAVHYQRFRPATGLSAFPNGGVPRVVEQSAVVYRVNVDSDEVLTLVDMDVPTELQSAVDVRVNGWRGDSVFVTLSGCPGAECYGDLRQFRFYRLAAGEPAGRLDSLPENLEQSPGSLARATGEEIYMRVSYDTRDIRVRTVAGEPFVNRYRLDVHGKLNSVPNNDRPRQSDTSPQGRR